MLPFKLSVEVKYLMGQVGVDLLLSLSLLVSGLHQGGLFCLIDHAPSERVLHGGMGLGSEGRVSPQRNPDEEQG